MSPGHLKSHPRLEHLRCRTHGPARIESRRTPTTSQTPTPIDLTARRNSPVAKPTAPRTLEQLETRQLLSGAGAALAALDVQLQQGTQASIQLLASLTGLAARAQASSQRPSRAFTRSSHPRPRSPRSSAASQRTPPSDTRLPRRPFNQPRPRTTPTTRSPSQA